MPKEKTPMQRHLVQNARPPMCCISGRSQFLLPTSGCGYSVKFPIEYDFRKEAANAKIVVVNFGSSG